MLTLDPMHTYGVLNNLPVTFSISLILFYASQKLYIVLTGTSPFKDLTPFPRGKSD